jgi:hypothetical protein
MKEREIVTYLVSSHEEAERLLGDLGILGATSWGTWSCLEEDEDRQARCMAPNHTHQLDILEPYPVVLWVGTYDSR